MVRILGPISAVDSVKEPLPHNGSTHRHRLLHHRSRSRPSPYDRSSGHVTVRPFSDVESTPQAGHAAAAWSSVDTVTSRVRSASQATRSTLTPANPNNNVVSFMKPVAPPSSAALTTARLQEVTGPPTSDTPIRHLHANDRGALMAYVCHIPKHSYL